MGIDIPTEKGNFWGLSDRLKSAAAFYTAKINNGDSLTASGRQQCLILIGVTLHCPPSHL